MAKLKDANLSTKLNDGRAYTDVNGVVRELKSQMLINNETGAVISPTLTDRVTFIESDLRQIALTLQGYTSVFRKIIANHTEIYPQIDIDFGDNNIHIRAHRDITFSTSIIYILPIETINKTESVSEDTGIDVKLYIHHGAVLDQDLHQNVTELVVMKEDNNGFIVKPQVGDIVANRLLMLRINPANPDQAIIINSSIYNSASVTNLVATHATFLTNPKVLVDGEEQILESHQQEDKLIEELDSRYMKKFVVGTVPIEKYTGNLDDEQIYIQVEGE